MVGALGRDLKSSLPPLKAWPLQIERRWHRVRTSTVKNRPRGLREDGEKKVPICSNHVVERGGKRERSWVFHLEFMGADLIRQCVVRCRWGFERTAWVGCSASHPMYSIASATRRPSTGIGRDQKNRCNPIPHQAKLESMFRHIHYLHASYHTAQHKRLPASIHMTSDYSQYLPSLQTLAIHVFSGHDRHKYTPRHHRSVAFAQSKLYGAEYHSKTSKPSLHRCDLISTLCPPRSRLSYLQRSPAHSQLLLSAQGACYFCG